QEDHDGDGRDRLEHRPEPEEHPLSPFEPLEHGVDVLEVRRHRFRARGRWLPPEHPPLYRTVAAPRFLRGARAWYESPHGDSAPGGLERARSGPRARDAR